MSCYQLSQLNKVHQKGATSSQLAKTSEKKGVKSSAAELQMQRGPCRVCGVWGFVFFPTLREFAPTLWIRAMSKLSVCAKGKQASR